MSNDAKVRAWRFYVEDMLIFCDKALRYMHGVERTSFALDPMRYDATLRNLELIGETATHVPAEVREGTPDIPWRLVVAVRNRLIHGYLGVDDDTLWSILHDELQPLRSALMKLLADTSE